MKKWHSKCGPETEMPPTAAWREMWHSKSGPETEMPPTAAWREKIIGKSFGRKKLIDFIGKVSSQR